MTLYLFRLLSPEVQLRYVLEQGTFLAQRWESQGGVNLYYLPDEGRGFFAEVGIKQDMALENEPTGDKTGGSK